MRERNIKNGIGFGDGDGCVFFFLLEVLVLALVLILDERVFFSGFGGYCLNY